MAKQKITLIIDRPDELGDGQGLLELLLDEEQNNNYINGYQIISAIDPEEEAKKREAKLKAYQANPNMEEMNELAITIFYSETNDGYMYDIYDQDLPEDSERPESIDGGCCTGQLCDALDMAYDQALRIINGVNIE